MAFETQQKGELTQKLIVLGVLLAALVGVAIYTQLQKQTKGPREAIEEAVKIALQEQEITNEEEKILRIQIAMQHFVAKNKRSPGSLYELVPTYFDVIPKNSATGKAYQCIRKGNTCELDLSAQTSAGGDADEATQEESSKPSVIASVEGEEGFVNPNEMQVVDWVYDPTDKRDPFRPFDFAPKEEEGRILTPLERYAIGQLKVTAILRGADEPMAIIEDSTGKGYTVRVGTRVGNARGEVATIDEDKVVVVESKVDFTGKSVRNVVEMKLLGNPNAGTGFSRTPSNQKSGKRGKKRK